MYNDFSFLKDLDKYITVDGSTITFHIQDGPIREYGRNGCQIDMLGVVLIKILESFDAKISCAENKAAIGNIETALGWLDKRMKRRTKNNVEGTSKGNPEKI